MNLSEYLDKAKEVKCLVVGDVILDKYISGDVSRISPEGPIPIVHKRKEWNVLGGAANVASNISGCEVDAILCGVIGKDKNAEVIMEELAERDITFCGIALDNRVTTTKTRIVGENQQIIRLDDEVIDDIERDVEECLWRACEEWLAKVNVLIISDYSKGVCTETLCKKIIHEAKKKGVFIIVDPKTSDWTKYSQADLITPNFKEYCSAIGVSIENNEEEIVANSKSVMEKYSVGSILVTRSQYGMTYIFKSLQYFSFATKAQEVYDVSGAGDTVIAVIAAFIAVGHTIEEAIKISNIAAAISVSKKGTYVVSSGEIFDALENKNYDLSDKIVSWDEGRYIIDNWKKANERVVFTNGCFDILHIGHILYLDKAHKLGDKLVVGINTDQSVKQIKGETRPINTERDRALLLSALSCVDLIILFGEHTPYELIKYISPDILVKGADYKLEEVVGRDLVEKVVLIDFVEGYSSTNLINKISWSR